MGDQLEFLAREPSLCGVDKSIGLTGIACDARERQSRTLPDIMVIDLCDRACDAFAQLRLDRPQMHALLLQ